MRNVATEELVSRATLVEIEITTRRAEDTEAEASKKYRTGTKYNSKKE